MITVEEWNDLLKKAELGDTTAQLEIANIYEDGLIIEGEEIVQRNLQLAFN